MGRIDKELLNYHSKYSKDGVLINKLEIENEEEFNNALANLELNLDRINLEDIEIGASIDDADAL